MATACEPDVPHVFPRWNDASHHRPAPWDADQAGLPPAVRGGDVERGHDVARVPSQGQRKGSHTGAHTQVPHCRWRTGLPGSVCVALRDLQKKGHCCGDGVYAERQVLWAVARPARALPPAGRPPCAGDRKPSARRREVPRLCATSRSGGLAAACCHSILHGGPGAPRSLPRPACSHPHAPQLHGHFRG